MADKSSTTFQSSDFSAALFRKLFEQKEASKFCDITLLVNNKTIKAHRNVLACNSPYFDAILKNHKIIREQIAVSCMDSSSFNAILNFMYTGEITVTHSIVEELLKLANQFLLNKVVDYCVEFLGTKLSVSNCLFTYFLTKEFKLKSLCDIVENWVASHMEEVCKEDEILELSPHQLVEFFKNKTFILSTNQALNVLSMWVLRDTEKREKHFGQLIKCFPTNDLEPVEVFHHLDTNNLYNKSELCLYRILDYLIKNNWMLSNFKTRYDVLQVKYGQILNENCMVDSKQSKSVNVEPAELKSFEKKEPLMIKAKVKRKQQILFKKLLLLGLKPDIRMSALKMLNLKKKSLSFIDDKEDNEANQESDEKMGIKCPICLTTINDSLLLEQHLALSHAKNVTYKCGLCSFVCQYHGDYLNHMKTHFSGPPFKCDFCDFNVEQITKLISHRAQHFDENIYQCTFCSFKCRLKQNFI
ncbi:unnamed protein product [Phyllotreta striolata]|uniref:BTB domain-containing protein n=1 Tax=Phyllotreta striolata TaxID=444603 RepID=A0A9N9TU98_PHYSR|nr:unnamed protein product [Phyllotreta striolata]